MKPVPALIRRFGIELAIRGYRNVTWESNGLRNLFGVGPALLPSTASRLEIRRSFKASCQHQLELVGGQTAEEWNDSLYKEIFRQKKLSIFKTANTSGGGSSVFVTRGHYLVLVKDGKMFSPPVEKKDISAFYDAFTSPDVLATTFYNLNQTGHVVIQNRFHTIEEWEAIIQQFHGTYSRNVALFALMTFISLNPRTTKVDKSCKLEEHVTSPLMESFLDYILSEQNLEFCQKSLVHYFKLCLHLKRFDLIEKAYRRAKEKVKIFGPVLMNECILLLEKTKYWKDTYHFFDVIKGWQNASIKFQHNIAMIALRHDDFETGFGLIGNALSPDNHERMEPKLDSLISCILTKFNYNEDPEIWRQNRDIVEYFFLSLAEGNIFPQSKQVAQKIADWFTGIKNERWKYAHINTSDIAYRRCPFTGVQLKQKELSNEEYDYLAKVILKEVIQRGVVFDRRTYNSNAYEFTHAREIKSFLTMMYEKGPFDIVIDGMNLYYNVDVRSKRIGSVHSTGELASFWLRNLVLTREKKFGRKLNVLIVFKHHVTKQTWTMFSDFATVWYSADDSEDDPYFLYGALLSGRRCKLLTLDQLKDLHHVLRNKFDYRTVSLIFKWQQIHQDLVMLKHTKRMAPQYFDVSVQRSPATWHFPYYCDSLSPLPNKWLCLKRSW